MEVRVVSLNILHGARMWDAVVDFLRRQDADIVLLQEVYDNPNLALPKQFRSYKELKKALHYPYATFAPAVLLAYEEPAIGKVVQGDAIYSKFPIIATDYVFFNEPYGEREYHNPAHYPTVPRTLLHAALAADGHKINVYNIHGVWDLDGDNFSERRRRMSDITIQAVKGKKNVILAGDTNAKPTNQAMRNIEKYLPRVFGDDLKTTFNVRQKDLKKFPGYASAAVDLMYVSPDVTVLAHDCPNVDISDHLPLTATLRLS